MNEQLERHLDRLFSKLIINNIKGCDESKKLKVMKKQEWVFDLTKLKVNNLMAEGAYISVSKGVYGST